MNAVKLAGTIIFVCLLTVIVLAAVGPCLVQDTTTGNPGGALDNIAKSIEQTNEALEDSPIGEWLAEIDASTN